MKNQQNIVQAMKCCLTNGKFALLLFSSILLFSSCGNELSRGRAEKLIREKEQFPKQKYMSIILQDVREGMGLAFKELGNTAYELQDKGLITINKDVAKNDYGQIISITYNISLTEEGKKYEIPYEKYTDEMKTATNNINSAFTLVKTYEIDFNSIINIQDLQIEKVANYDTKIINKTPFFEIINEQAKKYGNEIKPYQDKKIFRKYDDGWK